MARLDVAPPTSSFPSGHTAAAVALYGGIAILALRVYGRRRAALTGAVVLWCIPVIVGLSRLYRGMHYPSLAGALTGGLWLLLVILFAASCAWAIAARVRPGWPRRAVWTAAVAYAAAAGWSRIWLGVHWPTDVIGGWLFGLAWPAGAIAVVLTVRRRSAGLGTPRREADACGQSLPCSRSRQARPSGS